ncbi:Protein CBG26986 [Caenorhabditis briggsae]|uniref:Protein CBG26986 n=1 Tax=Caenorhabditis briggsae TaxID=6238 RepID=B6IEV2_CAEBR|nr:Protein CBG26986 [Caenorhabditis briggsae]CAR98432.1 Protein CBG26986 [Caenorhabditis briggsae]
MYAPTGKTISAMPSFSLIHLHNTSTIFGITVFALMCILLLCIIFLVLKEQFDVCKVHRYKIYMTNKENDEIMAAKTVRYYRDYLDGDVENSKAFFVV